MNPKHFFIQLETLNSNRTPEKRAWIYVAVGAGALSIGLFFSPKEAK